MSSVMGLGIADLAAWRARGRFIGDRTANPRAGVLSAAPRTSDAVDVLAQEAIMTQVFAKAVCLILGGALFLLSHAVVWQQAAMR
jgi:hypothetical protein